MKVSIIACWLLYFTVFLIGCKKFENYNNEIEIILPNDCNDCRLYISNYSSGEIEVINYYSKFIPDDTINNNVVVTLNWNEISGIDPEKKSALILVQPPLDHIGDVFYKPNEFNIQKEWIMDIYLKPSRKYLWDPENETLKRVGKTEKLDDGTSSSTSNEGDECYFGKFYRGNGDTWTLNSNGIGKAYFKDQNGVCSEGAVFVFDYTVSGGQLHISYNSAEVCGQSQSLPDDESVGFSCDESGIYIGSDFYER